MAAERKPTEDEVAESVAPILAAGIKQRRARLAAEAAEAADHTIGANSTPARERSS